MSSIMILFSCLGLYGAHKAVFKIESEQVNYCLSCYSITMMLIFTVFLIFTLSTLAITVSVSSALVSGKEKRFELKLIEELKRHPEQWIRIQDSFHCCGYDNTSDPILATGGSCFASDPKPIRVCREDLLKASKEQLGIVFLVCVVMDLLMLASLIASTHLACCVSPLDIALNVPESESLEEDRASLNL